MVKQQKEHPEELSELSFYVHGIQRMIMARSTRRQHPEIFTNPELSK